MHTSIYSTARAMLLLLGFAIFSASFILLAAAVEGRAEEAVFASIFGFNRGHFLAPHWDIDAARGLDICYRLFVAGANARSSVFLLSAAAATAREKLRVAGISNAREGVN